MIDIISAKPKILIVDDTPKNLQLLSTILTNEGFKVSFAVNGQEALRIINTVMPDLILLDVQMPGLNGFEVCRKIKEQPDLAHIPIIFLTARTGEDDIIQGFQLGGVDYVTKPYRQMELLMRVKAHIELKISRDVIARQKEELEETAEALQELNAMKDKFFSIIAHDLKSPFSGFIGFTELLHSHFDTLSTEEIKEVASAMHHNAQHLYTLIENLLSWARSQTKSLTYAPWPYSIFNSIRDVTELLRETARIKHVELINDADQNLTGFFDERLMQTVLRNLTGNAIKYSYPDSRIVFGAKRGPEGFITLWVKDSGMGIDPKNISSLFRIDVKYTSLGTNHESGTGLGLLICKEFVEKMGGTIWLESELGKGTTISFTVPEGELIDKQQFTI
ncbi:MAG: hybrid sensor histidine kinase/response regulator [Ignavibacteria bacterium]|nr:hybrid sensor histidine kinase/response regulator [Ignavibacteria bacterium]